MPSLDSFSSSEFDQWAGTYDASISTNQFPFFGYKNLLDLMVLLTDAKPGMSVIDLGTGTANLALRFAALGCDLWCTDFSTKMLDKARQKLANAHFVLHDLRMGLPKELDQPFDRIVSAYVFHHFPLELKASILGNLLHYLAPNGKINIGDIAFQDAALLEKVKNEIGSDWEDEYYWVADEAIPVMEKIGFTVHYTQVSVCAGIFTLES